MKLNEIIKENEYITSDIDLNCEIKGISTSAEETADGFLFILENPKKMPEIKEFSVFPVAILSSEEANFPNEVPSIKVMNARLASALIHSRFFDVDFSRLSIIGVTGTNGKTTTAYMIYKILCSEKIKTGFIGTGIIEICGNKISNSFYSMTTPDPKDLYKILRKMQDMGCEKVVMEVSSHALALGKTTPIPFEYGVFTNLSSEHTDFHSSMDEYFKTKTKLLSASKKQVINIDDRYGRIASEIFKKSSVTIGALFRGNYYATNIDECDENGLSYFMHTDKICYKTALCIPGIYNVYNSMLASAVCIDMGIPPYRVKEALSDFRGVKGRFEIIKSKIRVIIDYAHTEEAYKNLLSSIKKLKKNHKLTVVFGCGGERDKSKRVKIATVVENYADKIIVTEDNSRNESSELIFEDIKAGFSSDKYLIIKNRKEAIKEAVLNSEPEDFVAIIGKGAEEYNIDENGYHHFNDRETAESVLKEYENKS